MPSITIRHVPDDVRDELAARAAAAGQSLQEFTLDLLTATASKPSMDVLLERIRESKRIGGVELTTEEVLAHRNADRR